MSIELVNHGRDRLSLGDPRPNRAGQTLIRLGSYDDREHVDPAQRNRQPISAEDLEALKKVSAFTALVDKGVISVYGG